MKNLRCEKAVEKKHNGYNCAQAVACSFCKEASMDEDTLKKITQGFGAGLGTMAGTCGAISGAAVVAGLINQDKAGTSQTVRSVMNQFKQQNGTVICKDLKGVETGKVIRSCDDCEQVVKVNYRYKINWELGALIKLIIKEAMHIIRA